MADIEILAHMDKDKREKYYKVGSKKLIGIVFIISLFLFLITYYLFGTLGLTFSVFFLFVAIIWVVIHSANKRRKIEEDIVRYKIKQKKRKYKNKEWEEEGKKVRVKLGATEIDSEE